MLTTNRRGLTKVKQHAEICDLIDTTDREKNPARFHVLYQAKLRLERRIRIDDDLEGAKAFMNRRRVLLTSNN